MSNMRVLSVGQQFDRGGDGRSVAAATATLEVTPEEAERLAVAGREGAIQLVLRGYGDPDSIMTDGARPNDVLSQLRNGDAPRRTPPPPARTPRSSSAPSRQPAPAPAPTPVAVVVPPTADSVTVRIYRGDKLSQQKFKKDSVMRDTIKPPPLV